MILSASENRRDDLWVISLAYLTFIVLGMPGALLGVATPSMLETFNLTLDDFGLLFIASTAGYFLASFVSGRLMPRLGAGMMFALGGIISAVGLLGYIIAPSWELLLAFAVIGGLGGGIIDAGMNIYFAARFGPRLMNWLHACFGLGAALAPLGLTFILQSGQSWRVGYVLVAALYGLLAVLYFITRSLWTDTRPATVDSPKTNGASASSTLRLPIVWLGIVLFIAYAGLEASAGQWSFTLFTEGRGIGEKTAGTWVSLYWFFFTAGRIFFGLIVSYFTPSTLIRLCMVGIGAGTLLLWANPFPESGVIGLIVYGFALAPIFALLITNTQEHLGPDHGPNAIGFQVGAASIGVGILPGLAGVLANRAGLEIIPPFLLVMFIVMAVLYEISLRTGRVKAKNE